MSEINHTGTHELVQHRATDGSDLPLLWHAPSGSNHPCSYAARVGVDARRTDGDASWCLAAGG